MPKRLFDFTYHQPNSTSCNWVHVVANASNPIDDKLRDFHISNDCICLLYCDIVMAVSSMFAWLKAKLRCFKFVLFFNSNKICSSGISTWNKSNRSKLQIRANGFPVVCRNERSDRFLSDNSAKVFFFLVNSTSITFTSQILYIMYVRRGWNAYLLNCYKSSSPFQCCQQLKIWSNSILNELFACHKIEWTYEKIRKNGYFALYENGDIYLTYSWKWAGVRLLYRPHHERSSFLRKLHRWLNVFNIVASTTFQ